MKPTAYIITCLISPAGIVSAVCKTVYILMSRQVKDLQQHESKIIN